MFFLPEESLPQTVVYITYGINFCFGVFLDFVFFLKLADISRIFDFRITN